MASTRMEDGRERNQMGKKKKGQNQKQKRKQAQSGSNLQTLTLVTLLVVFLGLGVYAIVDTFTGSENADQAHEQPNAVDEELFAYDQQPVQGDREANVNIVEFGDFKCPVCKEFEREIFPKLKQDYLDNGQAGFYFINNQFIAEDSVTAGIAGEAVYKQDPEAFWKFYDAIYEQQGPEHEHWATKEFLVDLAKKTVPEIDHQKLEQAIEDRKYEDEVRKDKSIATQAGVTSVPVLFINGKPVPTNKTFDYNYIKQMIEEELKKQ